MKIFISGATGFIGINLAIKLAKMGNTIHAMYRSIEKTKELKSYSNIILFKGNILDKKSIKKAMTGCNQIYHVAAFTNIWSKSKHDIFDLNVNGSKNVFDAALSLGIKDIVFTSTAGIFGPSFESIINEDTTRKTDFFIEYERTKFLAEVEAFKYIEMGLNIRIVNPTRVYGPGVLSKSNSITIMIKNYLKGKWRIIPGNGKSIGNYVFIDDVVIGHVLAMNNGKVGERYILGGENIDYNHFFKTLGQVSHKKFRLIKLPLFIMLVPAYFAILGARLFKISPFITPALVRKFNYNWITTSQKANDKLGYSYTLLSDGMRKTIDWINRKGL